MLVYSLRHVIFSGKDKRLDLNLIVFFNLERDQKITLWIHYCLLSCLF